MEALLKYPITEKQERIAWCLTNLGALITAETRKHVAL